MKRNYPKRRLAKLVQRSRSKPAPARPKKATVEQFGRRASPRPGGKNRRSAEERMLRALFGDWD